MHEPNPIGHDIQSEGYYDKYARMFTRDDFTREQKVEAVKLIEIMVMETLEYYYFVETLKNYEDD